VAQQKNRKHGPKNLAEAIPEGYLDNQSQRIDAINLREVYNAFTASGMHLFGFVMNYRFRKEVSRGDKLIYFCQLASQYADELNFMESYECSGDEEYPLITSKKTF
jgi:glutathione peroxidase-family protein